LNQPLENELNGGERTRAQRLVKPDRAEPGIRIQDENRRRIRGWDRDEEMEGGHAMDCDEQGEKGERRTSGRMMVREPILKAMQRTRIPRPIISSDIKDMQLRAGTLAAGVGS
jgi:hypothetical protein